MSSKIVFEKVGQFVRRNFFFAVLTAVIVSILTSLSTFFEEGYVDGIETNLDLLIGFSLTILAAVVGVYFAIEVYESLKENRKASFISAIRQIPKRRFKMILLQLIIYVKTFLWTLLLIIPGIVKALEYQRATYALVNNPKLSISECFAIANRDMYGNKGKLFWTRLKIALPAILGGIIASIVLVSKVTISSNYKVDFRGVYEMLDNIPENIVAILLLVFALLGFIYSMVMNFPLDPVFNDELDKVTNTVPEQNIQTDDFRPFV